MEGRTMNKHDKPVAKREFGFDKHVGWQSVVARDREEMCLW